MEVPNTYTLVTAVDQRVRQVRRLRDAALPGSWRRRVLEGELGKERQRLLHLLQQAGDESELSLASR